MHVRHNKTTTVSFLPQREKNDSENTSQLNVTTFLCQRRRTSPAQTMTPNDNAEENDTTK